MESDIKKTGAPRPAFSGLIMLVIGAILGYAGGLTMARPSAGPGGDRERAYADGFEAAKKVIMDAGLVVPDAETVTTLSGTVTEVGASSFTLAVNPRTFNPFAEGIPETREVMIDGTTEIAARVPKDLAKFRAEFDAYQKKYHSPADGNLLAGDVPPPPDAFELKKMTLKDLKKGDVVSVTAAENVKAAATFTAASVFVTVPETTPVGGPAGAPPGGAGVPPLP